jgi:hypothetical protein
MIDFILQHRNQEQYDGFVLFQLHGYYMKMWIDLRKDNTDGDIRCGKIQCTLPSREVNKGD